MNALIPLTDNDGVQSVMGRDLHGFLEIGKDYSTWFKDMCQYGFSAGQDFSPILGNINRAGRPRIDHIVSLDMAKEISMIQRTDKGKQARQYFIECERRAKQPDGELSRLDLLQMAMDSERQRIALESRNKELEAPAKSWQTPASQTQTSTSKNTRKLLAPKSGTHSSPSTITIPHKKKGGPGCTPEPTQLRITRQ